MLNQAFSDPDLARIRERTPLKWDALDRVLDAPKLKLRLQQDDGSLLILDPSGTGREIFRLVLAAIADYLVSFAMIRRRSTGPQRKKLTDTFHAFQQAHAALQYTDMLPPLIPDELTNGMAHWISNLRPKRGPTISFADTIAIGYLLAFYIIAFGKQPGLTVEGPAARFLATFYTEMHNRFSEARWIGQQELNVMPPDLATIFAPRSANTLLKDILRAKKGDFYPSLQTDVITLGEGVVMRLGDGNQPLPL